MWDDKKFNDNTVGKNIKNIKSLMNHAFERGLHNNLHFKKKSFGVPRREADTIYLSEDELTKILSADLRKKPYLERVRDIFYVACWLGLRFSDLIRVSRDKFQTEDNMTIFRIEMEKTDQLVAIPVAQVLMPILHKYNFNLPVISIQKLNKYLKELGEISKINQIVEVTDIRAGTKIRTKHFKYELITTHTARRSFATNLYLQGVRSQTIMAFTGHRTERAFLSYLKLTHMQKVKELHTHFKSKMQVV
jgi:integrase